MHWTSGYVADLGYTHGAYRELTPAILRFVQLVQGVAGASDAPAICELGCGQGFSANLLAAADPAISYYATDFNPGQIAGAQALATAAATPNLHLFDDSFAEFEARTDLPQFDIIALHGIWSWIGREHRETIIRFIDARLKPGGLVYISYNCLPGWSAPAPLRHLMYLSGQKTGGPTGGRLDPALGFVEQMFAAKAKALQRPGLKERFDKLKGQARNYLAHEYFNDAWDLFYHSDVAADLWAARLTFVGSAHLFDHVDAINLTADQQKVLAEAGDPVLRETLRDYMVNQQFRRDVFARGTVGLAAGEAHAAWLDTRFALSTARAEVPMKVTGSLGEANLQEDVYAPLLDAFAAPVAAGRSGAMSLRQVLADNPKVAALGFARVQQAVLVLVGANHLQPCPADIEGEGRRRESAARFNRAVMEKARHSADLAFLASPVTGGGVAVDRFQQLFLLARASGEAPAGFAWNVLASQGQRIVKDGTPLQSEADNLAELDSRVAGFEARLPVLMSLGVA